MDMGCEGCEKDYHDCDALVSNPDYARCILCQYNFVKVGGLITCSDCHDKFRCDECGDVKHERELQAPTGRLEKAISHNKLYCMDCFPKVYERNEIIPCPTCTTGSLRRNLDEDGRCHFCREYLCDVCEETLIDPMKETNRPSTCRGCQHSIDQYEIHQKIIDGVCVNCEEVADPRRLDKKGLCPDCREYY